LDRRRAKVQGQEENYLKTAGWRNLNWKPRKPCELGTPYLQKGPEQAEGEPNKGGGGEQSRRDFTGGEIGWLKA